MMKHRPTVSEQNNSCYWLRFTFHSLNNCDAPSWASYAHARLEQAALIVRVALSSLAPLLKYISRDMFHIILLCTILVHILAGPVPDDEDVIHVLARPPGERQTLQIRACVSKFTSCNILNTNSTM
ncbi:hypothetical protein Y032_0446g1606 [Ancylostoma ceylanicum]|uniref:Uncharacterized protein n=1 Tax=Ancylostoma ceylanicum TaxID=53326 RepID=A0A016WYJ2_9BILA|nr:hypothetical protein Y032_0446g1606 [Ancylostoma ceylanicum]